jgi:recombination protein RecR
MHVDRFPSRLLENAVNEFSKLPGIGRKSALRLVLHLLKQDILEVEIFGNSLIQLPPISVTYVQILPAIHP